MASTLAAKVLRWRAWHLAHAEKWFDLVQRKSPSKLKLDGQLIPAIDHLGGSIPILLHPSVFYGCRSDNASLRPLL